MRTLNLKLQGGIELNPIIELNGETITYKRNKYKNVSINYETEKDYVDIEIKNILEIKGPCWWLVQMLFYIISLFGILNPRLEKNCYYVSYKARIKLNENSNNITLKFNIFKDKSKAIEVMSENEIEESLNEYSLDLEAKKRKKILKISHIITWILLITIAIIIII